MAGITYNICMQPSWQLTKRHTCTVAVYLVQKFLECLTRTEIRDPRMCTWSKNVGVQSGCHQSARNPTCWAMHYKLGHSKARWSSPRQLENRKVWTLAEKSVKDVSANAVNKSSLRFWSTHAIYGQRTVQEMKRFLVTICDSLGQRKRLQIQFCKPFALFCKLPLAFGLVTKSVRRSSDCWAGVRNKFHNQAFVSTLMFSECESPLRMHWCVVHLIVALDMDTCTWVAMHDHDEVDINNGYFESTVSTCKKHQCVKHSAVHALMLCIYEYMPNR